MKNIKFGHAHPVVCLDAGHYGKYNRSPVVPQFYESEFNWKMHNLLAAELAQYGIEVRKTRSNAAEDLALTERGKLSKECDLFLSIHANAADNENADYVLGIHMVDDDCGRIDEQSRTVAKLLSGCVSEVMGAKSVVWTQESSKDRDGNGKKDDYYGVLRGAHSVGTAGVILEHGFFTNKKQAQMLLDDRNLHLLAEAEAKVLADWFGAAKTVLGNPYTVQLVSQRKGCRGQQVEAIQTMLIAKGYSCGSTGVDGSFGARTEAAVKAYQTDMEMQVDGIVGKETISGLLGYR